MPDETVAVSSFADVVRLVEAGEADRGVLAIESSVVGPVAETHDLLFDSDLPVRATWFRGRPVFGT